EAVDDDRQEISKGDRLLLIVEDDIAYARILLDIAHSKGFKGIIAMRGETALHLAQRYRPDAITLDIALPDMEGWTVLDRLKHDKGTRHIPVHIISADEENGRGLKLGALAQVQKPVTKEGLEEAFSKIQGFLERKDKSLLVIEDSDEQRKAITELIGGDGAQAHGRGHHHQGRALAGPAARRDRAVPAPRRVEPAREQETAARATARIRSGAGRQARPDRRRRHAQHLRADLALGAAQD